MTTNESEAPQSAHRHDPLRGVRVLDFTMIMSGPMCTRTLADSGADVIKVEPPSGDAVRQRPPFRSGIGTYFASMNCGKRSIVLDLSTEEGLEIARELADCSDVLVENFRPGVMRRLGLDFASLSKRNPRLIYCSISGFGQDGPMAHAPAYAPVIHASSGYDFASMQYQRAERPPNNGIFVADVLGAAHAASAIHLALFDRERTGRGQQIDLSLLDAVVGMQIWEIQAAQSDIPAVRQVYEPVHASDGFVMVAVVTPKNLRVLFDAIDYPQGHSDPRFATVQDKERNWSALLGIIEAWTIQRTAAQCESLLMQAGVPCSRYRTMAEVLADPQAIHRHSFERVGADGETFQVANPAFQLSGGQARARQNLPLLGQDTEEVLREVLGKRPDELDRWRRRGVLGPDPQSA